MELVLLEAFADLSTALVADACVRAGLPVRAAPPGIRAVVPGLRIAGRALPVRHYGSAAVFLELLGAVAQGDVLVRQWRAGHMDIASTGFPALGRPHGYHIHTRKTP